MVTNFPEGNRAHFILSEKNIPALSNEIEAIVCCERKESGLIVLGGTDNGNGFRQHHLKCRKYLYEYFLLCSFLSADISRLPDIRSDCEGLLS